MRPIGTKVILYSCDGYKLSRFLRLFCTAVAEDTLSYVGVSGSGPPRRPGCTSNCLLARVLPYKLNIQGSLRLGNWCGGHRAHLYFLADVLCLPTHGTGDSPGFPVLELPPL